MLVEKKVPKGSSGVLFKKEKEYVADEIKNSKAIKKENIIKMIDEGSQLTLLATLIEQIGDKIGLDTPEFTQAKEIFANIKQELNK